MPYFYFATDPRYPALLERQYPTVAFQAIEDLGAFFAQPLAEKSVIFLFSPQKIEEGYIALEEVWRRYLSLHAPDCKLVGVGFAPLEESNYLDLLKLPADLDFFLSSAQTVKDLPIYEDRDGIDVRNRLKRFYDGHGTGEDNVITWFLKAYSDLKYAHQEIQNNKTPLDQAYPKEDADMLLQYWDIFMKRWDRAQNLFPFLPFFELIEKKYILITEISLLLALELERDENWINALVEPMHSLIELSKKVYNQYVIYD
jgi:hypothetical protein